ncbi:DUF2834 domain-containing protein [Sphingomonas sp. BIUV-7]|uniref:DUF2834 domain-containing protein n=1 Tax=Sphingomonas natans TaxID=3063330 RepID=A0ABT8YB01_9SPHN|nr:DUF2834 domain-containing protein [Sphingomonas sp. BIUV-7]MDO6415495.1 DUF2834 domain-containing protein [Sphingomonas sp. BIUV-7]
MARIYWLLAVLGTMIPLAAFLPWLAAHGLDVPLLLADLFANRVSAFFGLDVIVSAVVLILFVAVEGRRLGMRRRWLPVVATCLIGVSCGLPLFLALREAARTR